MKKVIVSIFVVFIFTSGRAQFGPSFFIDTLMMESFSQLACADFNHDGVIDILTSNLQWPNDHMHLYLQTEGQVFTYHAIPEADSLTNLESFDTGDVIKDGWTDFIVASQFPWRIMLYENDHGTFIPHLIDDSLDLTSKVLLDDFNHDGLLDILSLQHVEIVLYLAIDEGVFAPGQVIHSGTEFYALDAAHYNQDTFLDVAVASDGFEILLNDGTGHFVLQSSQGTGLDFGLESGDLDGDQDVDIAVFSTLTGIHFYANDGEGHFEFKSAILESTDNFLSYVLTDMDCDGDVDLYTSVPQIGHLIVVENSGNALFDTLIDFHTQTGELVGAVTTGDLNDDGRPDPVWGYFTLGAALNTCSSVATENTLPEEIGIGVYPNPTSNYIMVSNKRLADVCIDIYDSVGRNIVFHQVVGQMETRQYDLTYPGIYFVVAYDRSGRFVIDQKIIIQGR